MREPGDLGDTRFDVARDGPSHLAVEVCSWGMLGDFKRGLELLALEQEAIRRSVVRLPARAGDKLRGMAALPPN